MLMLMLLILLLPVICSCVGLCHVPFKIPGRSCFVCFCRWDVFESDSQSKWYGNFHQQLQSQTLILLQMLNSNWVHLLKVQTMTEYYYWMVLSEQTMCWNPEVVQWIWGFLDTLNGGVSELITFAIWTEQLDKVWVCEISGTGLTWSGTPPTWN